MEIETKILGIQEMQYRKITDLKKLQGNPRIIRDKQFQNLVASIRENPRYFEARPLILSDRTGELIIIAGNQRYEAAKVLKLEEVPTFLIEGITEEKEKEITIRDNTQQGEWDMDLLSSSWSELPLVEWGVELPADWLISLNDSQLPESGSGSEKEQQTTCPKCGFTYAI